MQAIEIDTRVDEQGEIHIKLPAGRATEWVRVIVLFEREEVNRVQPPRHRPSPHLAGKGAKLHGDDLAPAFSQEDWGDLYR